MYKGRADLSGDTLLSTAISNGIYFIRNSSAADTPWSYAFLIVDSVLSAGFRVTKQEVIRYETGERKFRVLYGNTIGTWISL